MRFKNEDFDLKLYVVAGTTTALLSFDIAQAKLDDQIFLGFSIERLDLIKALSKRLGAIVEINSESGVTLRLLFEIERGIRIET